MAGRAAKKKKKKKKRAAKQRDRLAARKADQQLARRLQRSLSGDGLVLGSIPGAVKMSDVLMKFIEPHIEIVDCEETLRKLLGMGVAAWNIALLPKAEHESAIVESMAGIPADFRDDGEDILRGLMTRKERHFAKYRRAIFNYEISDAGDHWHISVASTLGSV